MTDLLLTSKPRGYLPLGPAAKTVNATISSLKLSYFRVIGWGGLISEQKCRVGVLLVL